MKIRQAVLLSALSLGGRSPMCHPRKQPPSRKRLATSRAVGNSGSGRRWVSKGSKDHRPRGPGDSHACGVDGKAPAYAGGRACVDVGPEP